MSVAIITGASRGLGRALARSLAARDWRLVLDARTARPLAEVAAGLPGAVAVPGNVTDHEHRGDLVAAARRMGGIDLLVNNASDLGPSPLPHLRDLPVNRLAAIYAANVFAPHDLIRQGLPDLAAHRGVVINISSDAAVEAYPGWGGYGSAKGALDQLSAVLAVEEPGLRVFAVDPGDMRTEMHQAAYPGEDITDRPEPETVVPALLRLLDERPQSGRYRAADFLAPVQVP